MLRLFRATLSTVMLCLAFPSQDAAAQVRLSVSGGTSIPLGDLADDFDTGWHAQASAGLSIPLIPIALRIDGALHRFPEDDGHFQVITGSLNGIVSLPSILITPYLLGGVGVYNNRISNRTTEPETTNAGVNLGAGLRLGLPFIAVFGEARLHTVLSDEPRVSYAQVGVGIHF